VKKLSKKTNVITFQQGDDNEALAMAMLGMSNKAIKRHIDGRLSDGQITYRLAKAKRVEGNKFGYRVDYRNGESPVAQQIINDVAGILHEEIRRNVTMKITHPTPETVNTERSDRETKSL